MNSKLFSRWLARRPSKSVLHSLDTLPLGDYESPLPAGSGALMRRATLGTLRNFFLSGGAAQPDVIAWNDYMIPGWSVKATGNSPPDILTGFAGNANLELLVFDGNNTMEQVFFTVQLPHDWKEGSTIFPHVHLSPVSTNSSDLNSRVVRFGLEYTLANPASGTFGGSSTIYMDTPGFVPNTSQWAHIMASHATGITMTGSTISCMMICRLFRNPADSVDTYPQDAAFLQFDIHYQVDSLGSASIAQK